VITPNRQELADATGRAVGSDDELVAAARQIIETCEIGAVLVTRSQDGLSVVPSDGEACHLPTQARSVYDVSGAGDTVVASFAVALGQAIPLPVAAEIANLAAGIVVGKTGTATAFDWELRTALDVSGEAGVQAKIKARDALRDAVKNWRASNLTVGLTNGCFDLLHPGHMSLLREAKSHCDRLIVAINSDQSVRRLKGPDRPIQLESARADVLASLEMVDGITVFDEDTPEALIELLRPDVLVKGADYSLDEVVGGEFVKSYGGNVVLAAIEPNFSTTDTIARMRKV